MGWTNVAPEVLIQLKADQFVITTNGVDVANPVFLIKFAKGRVHGTLVYPNALAGVVLMLLPLSLVLAVNYTGGFRPATRVAVIGLTLFLGVAGLFWTGSKSGWLIAMGVGGLWLLRLNWAARWKWTAVAAVAVIGLVVFAVRFHSYFAEGATSVGARFDYWRAAGQIAPDHPVFGTGPGTFQRPYARLKSPTPKWRGWFTTTTWNSSRIPGSSADSVTRRGLAAAGFARPQGVAGERRAGLRDFRRAAGLVPSGIY